MGKVNILKEFKGGSMARTFLVDKYGQKYVRKIAANDKDGLGIEKLYKQWKWQFDFCRNDEPGVMPDTSFFVFGKDSGYYDMEYVELGTFLDLLLNEEDIDGMILHDILKAGSLIAKPVDEEPKHDYLLVNHLQKMVKRTQSLQPYEFYKHDSIDINGKSCQNLHRILEFIVNEPGLIKLLSPKKLYRSHGDFTFQNILADEYDLVVIDPRGEGADSIYYDISKLYQSCHGKYDLLFDGNYRVWSDGYTDVINYEILDGVEKFNAIYDELRELIPQYYEIEDEHWELITKFYEASHFISMTPFRLKENGNITAVCYAIGIELLNEVVEEYLNVKSELKKQESITI
jgi:thiamine kinase-like enzyme